MVDEGLSARLNAADRREPNDAQPTCSGTWTQRYRSCFFKLAF